MRYFNRVRWIVLLSQGKKTHTMKDKIISREKMEKKLAKLGNECKLLKATAAAMEKTVEDLRTSWHAARAAERKLAFNLYWSARKELMAMEQSYSRRYVVYCELQLALQSFGI